VTWIPQFGDGRLNFTVGANNLLDEDPPECYSCSLNGYDASTYDPPQSRFYYFRTAFEFE